MLLEPVHVHKNLVYPGIPEDKKAYKHAIIDGFSVYYQGEAKPDINSMQFADRNMVSPIPIEGKNIKRP